MVIVVITTFSMIFHGILMKYPMKHLKIPEILKGLEYSLLTFQKYGWAKDLSLAEFQMGWRDASSIFCFVAPLLPLWWTTWIFFSSPLPLVRGGTYETFSKLELFYKWKSLWSYMRLLDVKRFLLTILPFYSSPHQITFRSTSLKCEILKLFYQRLVGCLSRGSEGYAQKSRFFSYLIFTVLEKSLKTCQKIAILNI